jgi:hypothetical protein
MDMKLDDAFNLNEENVLFFIRIRGKKNYFKNVYGDTLLSSFSNITEYRTISEYSFDADIIIDLNSTNRDYLTQNEFLHLNSLSSIDNIIKRCRGLRSCKRSEAVELISRTYIVLNRIYAQNKDLKLIVTNAIDNFVMHMMVLIGKDVGIKFLPITGSFMSPEYSLMILDGYPSFKREVSNFEIDTVMSDISLKFRKKRKNILLKVYVANIYSILSKYYRYFFRYLLKYKLMKNISYENRFANETSTNGKIWSFTNFRYYKKSVKKTDQPSIYIPLHWYPEATTDYWISDEYFLNYYSSLYSEVDSLVKKGFRVLVKEHPHFGFQRDTVVYKKLQNIGAEIISPSVDITTVFEVVDLVIILNGSTAIEAAIYGKPVARLTNSYFDEHIKIYNYDDKFKDYLLTRSQITGLLKQVLSVSFKNIIS